ncbi:MAG: hypothetical protein KDD51_02550 [Bdellovibrionales bacterium]|nr:hypothetical protein [Bdellovibrionales bacterium]
MRFFHAILLSFLLSGSVYALGGSKTPFIGDHRLFGIWTFIGVDAGWTWLDSRVAGEADKQGPDAGVAMMFSYYRKAALFEMGAKLKYKNVAGVRSGGLAVGVDTLSLAWESAIRFRFGEIFHAGPFFSVLFGEDLSYRPALSPILASEQSKSTALMAGFQLMFETNRDAIPMRLGIRFEKYLDTPNRSIVGAQVVYQVGFRVSRGAKPGFIYNTSR